MAVRRLKNGRLVVELEVGGTRIFRRLPAFATKADAQALEARIRRELWERSALGRPDEPSLAAAIELWLRATDAGRKDRRNPRQNARHLRPFVAGRTIRQVGEAAHAAIGAWSVTARRADTGPSAASLTPATINRRLDVLRAATRWAWKQGMVSENLSGRVPRLREENARQVYLTPKQIRLLAASAPNMQSRAAIIIASYTGLRANELLAMPRVAGSASLLVSTSKSGKSRTVPVAGPARASLRALPLGCSYRRLIGWFWEARAKAGMEHVRFHDLRHSCASMLINAGVDLYTVGKILGHSSPQTTARYAHLTQASLRKAMRRLK
jgi:site-specific recombinase XerD